MTESGDEQRRATLGRLEENIMRVLWNRGESNVRDVTQSLPRRLAYTTVMTTLDRLFKKGLLSRRKQSRAFYYSASMTPEEFSRRRLGDMICGLLGARNAPELLASCLLDAVGEQDEALLNELEKKIKLRREELARKAQP
jgi:predicted transcriptional regulator